jgi:hypothetical protein
MDEYESIGHSKWECKCRVLVVPQMPSQNVVPGASAVPGRGVPDPRRAEAEAD